MKHWLVTIEFLYPYPRKYTFRVQATHQLRAPAAALPLLKKQPELKGKRLGALRMTMRVEPMGVIQE